ncbi:hypothetical protein BO94DRAFT_38174 [Aspergillus sclerotioniger CBS 115572]|uniref:Uncharacterized protein n=1 Tax=Aspergillus sclerotioniger CBS 115572 TaxID=1450535 RepID=A0A317WZ48_9EURO|nr:hypothetical protein BO94DRAFT_38174 [Aspergillus sclerotioniger CBS 115572]PWY89500.1 hypothetical protein BO94DRAFT_38174 [Aspergillus sclerotioniger CBS 115572]
MVDLLVSISSVLLYICSHGLSIRVRSSRHYPSQFINSCILFIWFLGPELVWVLCVDSVLIIIIS